MSDIIEYIWVILPGTFVGGALIGWLMRARRAISPTRSEGKAFDPQQKQHPSFCPTCGNRLELSHGYGNECARCGARFVVKWSN